jgi:hypothetical protein
MSQSSLARLWSHAASALSRLRSALMPLDTLLAKERRDLRTWLRALEAFCRRLALTEALQLPRLDREPSGSHCQRHTQASLKAHAPKKRLPRLRLWPRTKRHPARIRLLGPPTSVGEIWRDQKREALLARLKRARARRKPAHLRIADRIDALQSFLDAPRAAIRRLARKLSAVPKLAFRIAARLTGRRPPPSPYLADDCVNESCGLCWTAVRDSS